MIVGMIDFLIELLYNFVFKEVEIQFIFSEIKYYFSVDVDGELFNIMIFYEVYMIRDLKNFVLMMQFYKDLFSVFDWIIVVVIQMLIVCENLQFVNN